jgi:hypothetical protein
MRAVNPKLNAFVVDLSGDALKAAKAADRAQAKGIAPGLLHGAPITIKENADYEGEAEPERCACAIEDHRAVRCAGRAQSQKAGTFAARPRHYVFTATTISRFTPQAHEAGIAR